MFYCIAMELHFRQNSIFVFDTRLAVFYATLIGHIRILGIGLELACKGGSCGGISLKRDECHLHLKRLPRISLSFNLVPGQYREYEYGLLHNATFYGKISV